jgi:hypothetical protein
LPEKHCCKIAITLIERQPGLAREFVIRRLSACRFAGWIKPWHFYLAAFSAEKKRPRLN